MARPAATSSGARASSDDAADGPIATEPRTRDGARVRAAVVVGHDLEVLVTRTAVAVVVLDACVGEVHMPVVVRQVVLARPARNLVRVAVRPTVAVLAPAVPLVEEALVVALELVVQ